MKSFQSHAAPTGVSGLCVAQLVMEELKRVIGTQSTERPKETLNSAGKIKRCEITQL